MMWQLKSSISGAHYENFSLTPTKITETMLSKSMSGMLEYSTPSTSVSVKPSLSANLYTDKTRNKTDLGLLFSVRHNTETFIFNLTTDTQRDSSFSSELTTTGYIDKKKDRKSDNYSPSATYIIDQLSTISLSHSFTDVDYIEGISDGLYDYEYSNSSLSYTRLTKSLGSISISYADISQKIDMLRSQYDTSILQFGLSNDYSETINYSVTMGLRHYKNYIGYANYRASDNGWVMNLNAAKQFDRASITTGISREVTPSGGGYTILQNKANLTYRYRLSPLATTTIFGTALKNTRETFSTDLSRYYGNFGIGINYNFAKNWLLSIDLQHRRNRSEEGLKGNDNALKIRLSYSGSKTPIKYYGNTTEF